MRISGRPVRTLSTASSATGRLVPEVDQCRYRVIHVAGATLPGAAATGAIVRHELLDLVFEFEAHPRCRLLPDAGNAARAWNHRRSGSRVTRSCTERLDRIVKRKFGTDAGNAQQKQEHVLLQLRSETEKGERILAHVGVNMEAYASLAGIGDTLRVVREPPPGSRRRRRR